MELDVNAMIHASVQYLSNPMDDTNRLAALNALHDYVQEHPETLRAVLTKLVTTEMYRQTDGQLDTRFGATVHVVRADSATTHFLWQDHHNNPLLLSWEQDYRGLVVPIGRVGGRNVSLGCQWHLLNGHRVLFCATEGQFSHYDLVEEWLSAHCCPRTPDGRIARNDAMNFHACIHHVRSLTR